MSAAAIQTDATPTIPDDIAQVLIDPRAYADERLHNAYSWLRANQPFGQAKIEGFHPFWVVTKHADILEISRQNDLFHSGDMPTTLTTLEAEAQTRAMTGGSLHIIRSLVSMDAPDHPKYRAMTQAWFMPNNIKKLEPRIREIAKAAVDKMAAMGGTCDFVNDVALHYPLHVIMEILGVPEEDEPRMLKLTQELFGATDPDTRRAEIEEAMTEDERRAVFMGTVTDFYTYFGAITADRRANPKDDLATIIANSKIDGQLISDLEALSYYVIVATAGHDTTSSSTAGAIWALAEDPAEFAKVKADPSLIPGMIDEAIRWTTPVKHFMRSATADAEVGGKPVKQGDWMMLCYASGNRDEEVFEDPFVFRSDRKPNKQLAFGYGAHLCIGQHLARMEMRILFEELLPRIKSLKLAGEPKLTQALFVNGPKKLPIAFELE